MSQAIPKGKRWQSVVNKRLESTDVGILCVTPENKVAPWLLFEAGAISKRLESSRVCPILFELKPNDLQSPLNQFQATQITKEDFTRLLVSLNSLLGKDAVEEQIIGESVKSNWSKLQRRIKNIEEQSIQANDVAIRNTIEALSQNGFGDPSCSNQAFFDHGYETFELYSTITKIAQKRLYIFGRKNRKIFDRTQYESFFQSLAQRLDNRFDLKVLFLDPNAPAEIIGRSSYANDFSVTLEQCIRKAVEKLQSVGIAPSKVCRMYSVDRPCCIVVIDDAVLCAPIHRDPDGTIKRTTDAAFSVVSGYSSCGQELLKTFLKYWNSGTEIK